MEAENSGMVTMFPSKGVQVFSCLIYILGASVLSHCISRGLSAEEWSRSSIRDMPWVRICVLLIFVDSWLFLFTSCILVFGIGLESNQLVCAMGIYICVAFYATSKILVYSFLLEKVYLVWSPSVGSSRRLKSPVYLGCMVMLGIYGVVVALMVAGRIHYLNGQGVCIIGLERYSSLTLLTYDLLVNIVLTALFLWPVLKANLVNPRLRSVAIRTLVASGVALTTSSVNMLVLAVLRGHERGWVCLGACGADVIFNALAIFWVTKIKGSAETTSTEGKSKTREIEVRGPGDTSSSYVLRAPPLTPQSATSYASRMPWPFSPSKVSKFEDVELQPSDQKASVVRSMKGLFRSERRSAERTVQVTVTTEYHIDEDIEAEIDRSDE